MNYWLWAAVAVNAMWAFTNWQRYQRQRQAAVTLLELRDALDEKEQIIIAIATRHIITEFARRLRG
jgi:tellurite resistance protein